MINEQELEAALARLGFSSFDCAAHSVREQAAAFKSADIVVAPHGAGLSNIVYCKPGTRVIEVIPEGYDQGVTSYRSLADLFGLQYEAMFAREERPGSKGNRCNSDISVTCRFFCKLWHTENIRKCSTPSATEMWHELWAFARRHRRCNAGWGA